MRKQATKKATKKKPAKTKAYRNGMLDLKNDTNLIEDKVTRDINLLAAHHKLCDDMPQVQAVDNVNHPAHYKGTILPNGIECFDVIEHFPTNLGTAIKYIWRCGHKGDPMEDLSKAIRYLERQKDLISGKVNKMH